MTPEEMQKLSIDFHQETTRTLDELGEAILSGARKSAQLELVARLQERCAFFAGTVGGFASKVSRA